MFDSAKPIQIRIKSGGEKVCTVRFPTDEEWSARSRALRIVRHSLGRGQTKTETLNAERIDAELFQKIRTDSGPVFDEAEAAKVISLIERANVIECESDGSVYTITMDVPRGPVTHRLKIPLQKMVMEYGNSAMSITEGRRQQQIRVKLEPAADLYDKIADGVTGYVGAVPIIHKSAVISELLYQLDNEMAEEEDSDPEPSSLDAGPKVQASASS